MRLVIIIGASGHGKVTADIIQTAGDQVVGFLDDDISLPDDLYGISVLGTIDKYEEYKDTSEFVIAIGNATIREEIAERLHGVKWYTAIHPSAEISNLDVSIGEGTVVMANAVINAGAHVGRHCIINSSAVVEHDNRLEGFVHISVGAKLGGTVSVGKATWVGIGSVINNNINICSKCMIGAGTVVIRDIEEAGTYTGVPAKRKHGS